MHRLVKNLFKTIEEFGSRVRALFSKLSMVFWLQIRGLSVYYLVMAV